MKLLTLACALLNFIPVAAFSAPIDLEKGYFEFQWGKSSSEIRDLAIKRYGEKEVTLEKTISVAGYSEPCVVVKNGNTQTIFNFLNDKFFSFTRKVEVIPESYYSRKDLDAFNMGAKLRNLFTPGDATQLNAYHNVRGSSNDRVTAVDLVVTATNQTIYDAQMAIIRAKGPGQEKEFFQPFQNP